MPSDTIPNKNFFRHCIVEALAFAGPEEQHSFGQDLPNEGAVLLDLDLLLLTFCHCRVIFPHHCLKKKQQKKRLENKDPSDLGLFACPDFCKRSGSQDRYLFDIMSIFSILFCCNAALRTTRGRMCVCMYVCLSVSISFFVIYSKNLQATHTSKFVIICNIFLRMPL